MAAARSPPRSEPANSHDFPSQSNTAQLAFRRIVGQTNPAIIEEARERHPALQHVIHRLRHIGMPGELAAFAVHPAIFLENNGTQDQGSLFVKTATLSEGFFDHLTKHPVPLEEAAIRAINNNSMTLDVYAWLAYRLHALSGPRPITWKALKTQFGAGYGRQDNFNRKFLDSVRLALAVYPAARVDVTETGLLLHP